MHTVLAQMTFYQSMNIAKKERIFGLGIFYASIIWDICQIVSVRKLLIHAKRLFRKI